MPGAVKSLEVSNGLVQSGTAGLLDSSDLTATGVVAGAYGDAAHTVTITVDSAGRVTAISENAISGGGAVTNVTASAPLSSSGGSTPNISLTGIVPVANGGTGINGSTAGAGRLLIGTGSGFQLGDLIGGPGISITPTAGQITIAATGGTGTVTSVGLAVPSWLTVSGSPVTSSGTLAISSASQPGNRVLASPDGTTGVLAPRALVEADIPPLSTSKVVSGVFDLARIPSHASRHKHGGTDEIATSSPSANGIPKADASGKLASGWVSGVLSLTDLSGVSGTTGTGSVVLATAPQFTGTVGIGTAATATTALRITPNAVTTGVTQFGVHNSPVFSASAGTVYGYYGTVSTANGSYTVTNAYTHYLAAPTAGAGSTITNAYGLYLEGVTGAVGANWSIYCAGTSDSRFGGRLGVGSDTQGNQALRVAGSNTIGASQHGVAAVSTFSSGATALAASFYALPTTANATFTTAKVAAFYGDATVRGTGNTIIDCYGLYLAQQFAGNTNWGIWVGGAGLGGQNYLGGNTGIGVTPSASFALDVNGACHASSFPTSSDARLKKNVAPITDALDKVCRLNGVTFEWNETYEEVGRSGKTGTNIGFIAQDVEQVLPELVTQWEAQRVERRTSKVTTLTDIRAVDYARLVPVLVEAIKELAAEVRKLKEQLTPTMDLEGKINE